MFCESLRNGPEGNAFVQCDQTSGVAACKRQRMHVGRMTACQQFFPAQHAKLQHTKRSNPESTVRLSSSLSEKVRHQANRSLIGILELEGKDADSAVWVNGQVAQPCWRWLDSHCATKS